MFFIDNNSIERSYLNMGEAHLKRRGLLYLVKNFEKFVCSLWKSDTLAKVDKHPKVSLDELKPFRIYNYNDIVLCLNMNSNRNKFDALKLIIVENVDILCIVETKNLFQSFSKAKFFLPGYHKLYRLDVFGKRRAVSLDQTSFSF